MKIQSINPQINKSIPTFQAVNQKYLERAQREFAKRKGVTGDLLDCIYYDTFFKQISKQDAIDTLKAIEQYVTGARNFFEHICEVISKLNQ